LQADTSTTSSASASNSTGSFWGLLDPLIGWVKNALTPYVGSPPQVPASTLFTVGLAAALGLATSTVAKLMVDYDMVRHHMQEFNAWRKELDKARKANDKTALAKLMQKQQAMTKLQARASMESMKVTMVTFVPFLLLWYVLSAVFGHVIVAEAPFPLPLVGTSLTFVSWYFLCSFAINLPMMKAFGIGQSES